MAPSSPPLIEKSQFKNQTNGWVGAVIIGPKGDDRGIGVEPGGTVWLSEPEQTLTANAPRKPEHNPFIEQTFITTDPVTGAASEEKIIPLVPIAENRYVPASTRPIPADQVGARDTAVAADAARADEPTQPTIASQDALKRHAEVEQTGDAAKPKPRVPPAAARAAAAAEAQADAPEETPETASPEEETASQVTPPVGEETGAALPPAGEAPRGEYAAQEEVGTPDAPQAGPPAPAAPHSPGSDPSMTPPEAPSSPPPPYTPPGKG